MNIKAEIGVIQEKHSNVPEMQCLSSSPHLAPPQKYFMSPFHCLRCSSTLLQAWLNFPHWESLGYGCGEEPARTSVWKLSARSQIQGMVKLVLIGVLSDLARAACDFAAAQNHTFYDFERGLAAE